MAKTTNIDFSSDIFTDCNQKLGKQVTEISNAKNAISKIQSAEYGCSFPDGNVSMALNTLYNAFHCKYESNVDREIEIGKKRTNISSIESIGTTSLCEQNDEILNFSTAINFLFGDLISVSGDVTEGLAEALVNCMNKSEYMNYTHEEIVVFEKALNNEATTLTREEKQLLIDAFEREFPEYASNMDSVLSIFAAENYYDHILNIKVLAYTANEPYRTLFLENVGDVKIQTLHETGTQNFKGKAPNEGGGVYINVDKMTFTNEDEALADARVYNTFFHECSHNIDYILGLRSNFFAQQSFTRTYVDDNNMSLSNALERDVRRRIDEAISDYLDPMLGLPQNVREDVREHVTDAIMNQIDVNIYGKPDFNNEYGYLSSLCYDDVCNNINNQLVGSACDNYGAFTGNTLSGSGKGGYHQAIRTKITDDAGNTTYDYRFYWIDGEYSEIIEDEDGNPTQFIIETDNGEVFNEMHSLDDPNLQNGDNFAEQIIYGDGDLVYNSSSGSEFFAETMAANMTRESVNSYEMGALDVYYDETIEYFENMVDEMLEYN